MRRRLAVGAGLAVLALASCAPRPAPPASAPPPAPAPPAPPPPAAALDWREAPLSPGDWAYRTDGGAPAASFGAFTLRCEPGGRIALALAASASADRLTVRTSYGDRAVPAGMRDGSLVAGLAASDPLLDQMLFSRGRFAVEAAGAATLILPAWPEPARVVEECRG